MAKQVPVLINYSVGDKRYEKKPDKEDLEIIKKINNTKIPYWYPTDELPEGYNTEQPKRSHGITHVHHFYTRRNLFALSYIFKFIKDNDFLKFIFTSINPRLVTKMSVYRVGRGKSNLTSGTLYVPSFNSDYNVIVTYRAQFKTSGRRGCTPRQAERQQPERRSSPRWSRQWSPQS